MSDKHKCRVFSIPFNGIEADKYLKAISPFLDHVDSVYLGLPYLSSSHASVRYYINDKAHKGKKFGQIVNEYNKNCEEFLELTRGMFKRLITLNSGFYSFTNSEMVNFVECSLGKVIEKYNVEGFIVTDFNMAVGIHKCYPHLELHTSCNCFQWNIRTMNLWKELAGISVFNPPREILRTISKLKEMHKAGFKLKCLVNESCLYGCPQTINHCMYLADNNLSVSTRCSRGDGANLFRSNWVLPRWLDFLDDYVDIYKISGRNSKLSYIVDTLRAYIEGDDNLNLLDIILGGTSNTARNQKLRSYIDVKKIPDRLLFCECKECGECKLCEDLYRKFFGGDKL